MVKFASPSCVCFVSFGFLLATICVWVWIVCSLHSVTTGSRDRANVSLIIINNNNNSYKVYLLYDVLKMFSFCFCLVSLHGDYVSKCTA